MSTPRAGTRQREALSSPPTVVRNGCHAPKKNRAGDRRTRRPPARRLWRQLRILAEYSFKAPASAFPGAEDLGDTDVDFEATLDQKGFLRELRLHGEAEGAGATVTETYEDIDKNLGIRPPDPGEVDGTLQRIDSREDLDALLGASTPERELQRSVIPSPRIWRLRSRRSVRRGCSHW